MEGGDGNGLCPARLLCTITLFFLLCELGSVGPREISMRKWQGTEPEGEELHHVPWALGSHSCLEGQHSLEKAGGLQEEGTRWLPVLSRVPVLTWPLPVCLPVTHWPLGKRPRGRNLSYQPRLSPSGHTAVSPAEPPEGMWTGGARHGGDTAGKEKGVCLPDPLPQRPVLPKSSHTQLGPACLSA